MHDTLTHDTMTLRVTLTAAVSRVLSNALHRLGIVIIVMTILASKLSIGPDTIVSL